MVLKTYIYYQLVKMYIEKIKNLKKCCLFCDYVLKYNLVPGGYMSYTDCRGETETNDNFDGGKH